MKPPAQHSFYRKLALIMGPVFLYGWTITFADSTGMTIWRAALCVNLGAAAIMIVLTVFGLKALEGKESLRRFNLSTVMLVMAPLSIYLAAFNAMFRNVDVSGVSISDRVLVVVFCLMVMGLTTYVLLAFADAIAWLAVGALRRVRGETGREEKA